MAHTYSVCPSCRALNRVDSQKGLRGEAVCGKCKTALKLHGLVSEVSAADMKRIIRQSELPVVVDFWAGWCGPCQMYGPEFQKASTENTNAVFLKVNTETEQALSAELGIRGIPCTIVYKNGAELRRRPGAMSAAEVRGLIA